MELILREDLKNLIPPLEIPEFKQLKENIISNGCLDTIKTWNNIIIDGHNRYKICNENNIEFFTEEISFDNIEEVKLWMIDNQQGRRNLTDGWKYELSQTKKELLSKKGKEKQAHGKTAPGKTLLSNTDKSEEHNTQKAIAEDLGWSTGKTAQADFVWSHAPEELKEEVKKGEKSINKAYEEVKKEKKKEQIEKKKEQYKDKIEEAKKQDKSFKIDIYNTDKKFRIIYADPPWQYDNDLKGSTTRTGVSHHYDSMSIDELCALPIKDITDKNSVLFLWITSPKLNLFLSLMESWGFEYKTSFVWDKVNHNMGHYNSVRHELLLIGGKGSSTPDTKKQHDSVISIEKSNKHSEKPVEFMNIIDELYVHGERLELFCRQPKKDNWFYWGNEV